MQAADRIFDLGPGAGLHGGRLLAAGSLKAIRKNKASLTGKFLRNGITHPRRGEYRPLPTLYRPRKGFRENWLVLKKASLRNLKGDDLYLPLGRLIMVCGISGAGKSTLIRDLLKPVVSYLAKEKLDGISGPKFARLGKIERDGKAGRCRCALSADRSRDRFRRVIEVTQSPIGKTPRSTPATYMGAFGIIRELFQMLPEARLQGHTASTYSFNTKGGRCESCKGAGRIKLAMNFCPTLMSIAKFARAGVTRRNWPTYGCRAKISRRHEPDFRGGGGGVSISWAVEGHVGADGENGSRLFDLGPKQPHLVRWGGAAAQTGERTGQRVDRSIPQNEPRQRAQPLHHGRADHRSTHERLRKVNRCPASFGRSGHTVIVIEHHLDLIAEADYVVEIGPKAATKEEKFSTKAPPPGLLKCKRSPTAPYLKSKLQQGDLEKIYLVPYLLLVRIYIL